MRIQKAVSHKILMICIILLLVTNIYLTAQGLKRLKSFQSTQKSLPCQALPIQFVMNEPECADKLLRSMNVSNVRVMFQEGLYSPQVK